MMRAPAPDSRRAGSKGPLAGLVQAIAGPLLDHPTSKACLLARDWRRVAGDELAAHTEPIRLANGALTVRVDSSAFASEISFRAPEIVQTLREQLQIGIKAVRCKTETLKFAPAKRPAPPPPLRAPTPEERARAAELTAGIEDSRLRRAVRGLLLVNMVRNASRDTDG